MMRSLYSAISGLKNHQVKMDVIGNNIANVNTAGFKRSRVSFATELSQTLKGASAPSPAQGGTNAMQVGLGMRIGSIDQIMTQGSSQSTGKATDMMLQGTGFFVLNNNGQQVYTRAGGFGQDSDGTLIDPATGAKVQGFSWGADDTTPVTWGAASDIRFKLGDVLATDSFFPIPESDNTKVLDDIADLTNTSPNLFTHADLEGAQNLTIDGMTRVSGTPSSGQFSFDPIHGIVTFASDFAPTATNPLTIHFQDPSDDGTGTSNSPAIIDTVDPDPTNDILGTVIVAYPPKPGATVYNNGTIPYTYTSSDTPEDGQYTIKTLSGGKYQITFGENDAGSPAYTNATGVTVPAVTTHTPTVDTTSISYDFINKPHALTDFSIDQSGVITGVYSNGEDSVTHKIAQIAVASFANDAGLQNVGGNFFTTTNNSGMASIGAAGEDGRASIVSNNIEMSNVDLSTEFTDMIVTQRGFQANSRVITVSDTLLEELINLKR
ncbi:flagellar hook protein FlgE [Desulfosporosinus nitroreducens]|uniref:Flagellar hook protein FlgE n=1 Tax=Desulfosporosinus nitroreducens TaxID=2018668 RepID=A0ABT8QKD9_9FIRM|nr:flagellar hook-basal body complex protein [Desulfosporosinus nitroreducens]MDO0821787.1 flagellar hook-basal body complex protein [Desulfosporosinus nitroreducens]